MLWRHHLGLLRNHRLERTSPAIPTDLERAFTKIDLDGNGTIDPTELKAAFDEAGRSVSEETINEVFKKLDTNGDKAIDLEEVRPQTSTAFGVRLVGNARYGMVLPTRRLQPHPATAPLPSPATSCHSSSRLHGIYLSNNVSEDRTETIGRCHRADTSGSSR